MHPYCHGLKYSMENHIETLFSSGVDSWFGRNISLKLQSFFSIIFYPINSFCFNTDKVWMYEQIMTNDDNLESNLLTSSLLKIRSLYKFC